MDLGDGGLDALYCIVSLFVFFLIHLIGRGISMVVEVFR